MQVNYKRDIILLIVGPTRQESAEAGLLHHESTVNGFLGRIDSQEGCRGLSEDRCGSLFCAGPYAETKKLYGLSMEYVLCRLA